MLSNIFGGGGSNGGSAQQATEQFKELAAERTKQAAIDTGKALAGIGLAVTPVGHALEAKEAYQDGSYGAAAFHGGLAAVGLIPGARAGEIAGKAIVKVGEEAVENTAKYLFRRGAYDTKELLKSQARGAENVIGVHGVSVSTNPVAKTGQTVRCATCSEVETAGFKFTKTGNDPNHYTVELPKPVTPEIVRIWNEIFK